MWHRDEGRPTRYRSVLFRSALEAKVAEQLDKLNVQWEYETPIDDVGWYLPDFTITDPADHQLPPWLEVKPAELLYALRDHVGCPERFDTTHTAHLSAREIYEVQITEVWKPKRLAEVVGKEVLVVSAINRNRTLSVLMRPQGFELSRCHPVVNHRQVLLNREREEREAHWRAEWDQRQCERQEQERQWRENIVAYARQNGRPARYDGWCQLCGNERPATSLTVYRSADGRWVGVCPTHIVEAAT